MTKYNKLVRDKIPEIIKQEGGAPTTHIAGDKEYWQKIKEKLREEVEEFNKDETITELTDILEVIDAICEHKKFDKKEIEEIKNKRAEERGEFEKKIILDEA